VAPGRGHASFTSIVKNAILQKLLTIAKRVGTLFPADKRILRFMEVAAQQPKPKRAGNYKPGPGRPRGRKNEATIAREAAMREANEIIGQALAHPFEGDAHALLVAVYKNPDVPLDLRLDAAKAALKAEKPALRAVSSQHSGSLEQLVTYSICTGVPRTPNDPAPAEAPKAPVRAAPERFEPPSPADMTPEAARAPAPAAARPAHLPRLTVLPRRDPLYVAEPVPAERDNHEYDPFAN
jgi:hypothetical protein